MKMPDEGLEALDRATEIVGRTSMREHEPEIYRLRGTLLLLRRDGERDAERQFRLAIDVSRTQEAKMFELRASTSLARSLHRQGRSAEARQMLKAIYGWFTEGFDTGDLLEAKALLAEL
jgi:predicted ATPase